MAGSKAGGAKARETNKARYGEDYYQRIGAKSSEGWAKKGRKPRGFAHMAKNDPKRLKEISIKGGTNRHKEKSDE